eukprot:SAG31_NODE_2696_length_5228_cov_2.063365_5_plen_86_part_00
MSQQPRQKVSKQHSQVVDTVGSIVERGIRIVLVAALVHHVILRRVYLGMAEGAVAKGSGGSRAGQRRRVAGRPAAAAAANRRAWR